MKGEVKSGKGYLDYIDYVLEKYKILVFFALFQLVAIVILAIGYFNLKDNLVLKVEIPPKLYSTGTLYIGSQKANRLYYKVWAQYAVDLLANYSPETIDARIEKFLYLLDPEEITKYAHVFEKKRTYVKNNLAKREFVMTNAMVEADGDFKEAKVIINGLAKETLGDGLEVKYMSCRYELGMKIEDFHLFITSFREKCKPLPLDEYNDVLKEYEKQKFKIDDGEKK